MRNYELVCILQSAAADELKVLEQSVVSILEKREINISKSESWGQRPLFHEAKKQNEGVFHYFEIQGQPDRVEQLSQDFKVVPGVLKSTICRAN